MRHAGSWIEKERKSWLLRALRRPVCQMLMAVVSVLTVGSALPVPGGAMVGLAYGQASRADAVKPLVSYEDVFTLEYASGIAASPDNRTVVYERRAMDIHTDRVRINLWMVDLDTGLHQPLVSGERQYYAPVFSPDGSRLAYLSNKDGRVQIYVYYFQSGRTARLTDMDTSPSRVVWAPDGQNLVFTSFVESAVKPLFSMPKKPQGATWAGPAKVISEPVYRADGGGYLKSGARQIMMIPSDGGTPRAITSGDHRLAGAMGFSPDGATLYFSGNFDPDYKRNPRESHVYALDLATGERTTLTQRVGPDVLVDVSKTGQLAVIGYEDERLSYQNSNLTIMAGDGTGARRLLEDLDRPLSGVRWASSGQGLYYSYDDEGRTHIAYVTTSGVSREFTDEGGGTTLGRPYTSGSFTVTDDGRVLFARASTSRPADLAVIDRVGTITNLTDLNGDVLGHRSLATVEQVDIVSSVDGLPLQAWVALPPGFDASKQYPLLLEIHGGPHAAYGPQFSMEIQMFAAAGYVVVYGNPRGSTSYGQNFATTIHHDYPSGDYQDLMDMVDAVIAKGYIDTDQLYVTGGSGGGVLTAWIVGKTDRFRAAVVAKPVINWASFVLTADNALYYATYWFPALPWEDVDHYWRHSPLSLVGNVTTPTMVLTGEEDYRTPISETEQYYQALQIRGIDSVMVRIPGASHGIAARPSNLVQKIGNVLAWFENHKD